MQKNKKSALDEFCKAIRPAMQELRAKVISENSTLKYLAKKIGYNQTLKERE